MMVKILLAITLVAWFSAPAEVDARCCYCGANFKCLDGKMCTPYCGKSDYPLHGGCNIFGCNCPLGCRHVSLDMDENTDTDYLTEQVFQDIDTDGNNLIDMKEGLRYLLQMGTYADLGKMVQGIQELTNDQGFITPGMFDASLEDVEF